MHLCEQKEKKYKNVGLLTAEKFDREEGGGQVRERDLGREDNQNYRFMKKHMEKPITI